MSSSSDGYNDFFYSPTSLPSRIEIKDKDGIMKIKIKKGSLFTDNSPPVEIKNKDGVMRRIKR